MRPAIADRGRSSAFGHRWLYVFSVTDADRIGSGEIVRGTP